MDTSAIVLVMRHMHTMAFTPKDGKLFLCQCILSTFAAAEKTVLFD